MASRQEEKERRREERLAAERAAEAKAARGRRLRLAVGGVLALALVAAIVVAVVASGGSGSGTGPKTGGGGGGPSAALPKPKVTDLSAAAQAAGCRLQDFPRSTQDRGHTQAKVKYKTNPPAFGPHNPVAASDGDYVGQTLPPTGMLVHSLEHGRIDVQYRPNLPAAQVKQLESLFNESAGPYGPGQYLLLFPNQTGMPYAVAATAWTHILSCPTMNPGVFDAIRAFRQKYTLKSPEFINQAE